MSGAQHLYRILGHFFFVFEHDIFVLDYSALDQVHACSKFWEGCYAYCENYRISGSLDSEKSDMVASLEKSIKWICKSMEYTNFSECLARSMKQSLAYLQNGFHPKAEKFEMGLEKRAKELEQNIKDILLLEDYWHEFILTLEITDRAKLDMAHAYYGLPAPDCDLELLLKEPQNTWLRLKMLTKKLSRTS